MRRFNTLFACLLLLPAAGLIAGDITDARIASIVVTANQVDVDAGAFVASRTNNAAVKSFAQLMVTDHNAVNRAATELVTKLKVTPQDNPTSQSLKAGGEKNLAALKDLAGPARSFSAARFFSPPAFRLWLVGLSCGVTFSFVTSSVAARFTAL